MKKTPKVIYIADRHPGKEGVAGDSLETVFKQHEPALRRFLRARLISEADQEDVVQDVFLRLAGADNLPERLSAASGNTRSYLFSIATHLVVDLQRRARVRRADQHDSYDEDSMVSEQPTPDMVAAMEEQLDTMVTVLNRLKPKCRRAFILSRIEQKSYPEIAREMKLSVPSVERYITLALAALRKGMQP